MLEQKLFFNNLEEIKEFVNIANTKDYDIELISTKYVVNAKSIMGVFSLDLTKPVLMRAHCDKNGELIKQIVPFICKQGN